MTCDITMNNNGKILTSGKPDKLYIIWVMVITRAFIKCNFFDIESLNQMLWPFLSKIFAYFSQFLPDLSLIILISRDYGCEVWKCFNFTWFLNKFKEKSPNFKALEKSNLFHNVFKVWLKCGNTMEVEFHNFFPFPRCGTEVECRISVVIVWNQNVELVWKLCGISVIKHIERILCRTSVEFFTFHIVEHQIHNMEYAVPQCRISVELWISHNW